MKNSIFKENTFEESEVKKRYELFKGVEGFAECDCGVRLYTGNTMTDEERKAKCQRLTRRHTLRYLKSGGE